MAEIIIRDLLESDIDSCVEMTITSFPWVAFGLSAENARKFFYDRLSNKQVFVAIFEDQIAGFIAIKPNILFANYIRRIVVRHDLRNHGIGSQLIHFIEELTIKQNLPNVFLITYTKNKGAIRFYKRNGYKIIGKIPDFIHYHMDEFILWKTMGPVSSFNVYD